MATPRALIVDDDPGFLSGLVELVKREGFLVSSAPSIQRPVTAVRRRGAPWTAVRCM